jgi:hypothetical protein
MTSESVSSVSADAASTTTTSCSRAAARMACGSSPGAHWGTTPQPGTSSLNREVRMGVTGSVRAGESSSATPLTNSRPWLIVRPIAG